MNTTENITHEITNECTCTVWNEAADECSCEIPFTGQCASCNEEMYIPSPECFGCFDEAKDSFAEDVQALMDANESGWWKVEGLRLWDGDHAGYFHARNAAALLEGMTVRASWIMRYVVEADCVTYSLSHHDAPTGSSSVLRPMSEDEAERLGL